MLDVPVLLLAWRRPDRTKRVIEALRAAAPTSLYVACDGARTGEARMSAQVREVRKLVEEEVDWPCELRTLYRDDNLGCRGAVSGAISWFFEQVEEGIVLEDDVVPGRSFFPFCAELLERYRDDTRVGVITADNFQTRPPRDGASYYFSIYNHCWGWASWRRAWRHYDAELASWPEFRRLGWLEELGGRRFARYWTHRFDEVAAGAVDSWAIVWTFSCWTQGLLTCIPAVNLARNIGFGDDATHTGEGDSPLMHIRELSFPLIHPATILRDTSFDAFTFEKHFEVSFPRRAARKARRELLRLLPGGRG